MHQLWNRGRHGGTPPVSGTPKGSFPKSMHLLKRADFQRVYQQGKRHFSGNMTVFYLRTDAGALAACNQQSGEVAPVCEQKGEASARVRVGFTVPRAVGKSVERNRIRRRTREAVRFHIAELAPLPQAVDIVINPKRSTLSADFAELSGEVERAFRVVRENGGAPARPLAERRPARSAKTSAARKRKEPAR
ncbi:MAG TPA: ribonuclease P protein component [Terriglobales bacterium]